MLTIQENQTVETRSFGEKKDNGFWTARSIFKVEGITKNELLVYFVLSSYADYETGTAWPSYETIAADAKISRRTAIDAVSSLVKKGVILKEVEYTDPVTKREYTSNFYTVLTPVVEAEEQTEQKATARRRNVKTRDRVTSAVDAPPLVQGMHHPSAEIAPELNHLRESDLNKKNVCMYDAHDSNESVLKPSEKEKTHQNQTSNISLVPTPSNDAVSEEMSQAVMDVLKTKAKRICFVEDYITMGDGHIRDVHSMLLKQYADALSPDLVYQACEIYANDTSNIFGQITVAGGKIANPAGWFYGSYKKALVEYKANRYQMA